jgi:hypothetical protein
MLLYDIVKIICFIQKKRIENLITEHRTYKFQGFYFRKDK